MRAPLRLIEPISSGVSKVTRGERASASVRLTIWAGWVAGAPGCTVPCVPGAPGWPVGACGVPFGVDAVCCWLTGGLAGGKAYCQPTMISTESTIATMKFFWSI